MVTRRVFSLAAPAYGWIALAVLASVLSVAVSVGQVGVLVWFVKLVWESGADSASLIRILIALAVALVLRVVLVCVQESASVRIAGALKIDLRDKVLGKIIDLGLGYQHLKSSAVLAAAGGEGVEALEVYFGKYIPQLLACIVIPLGLFGCIALIDIYCALVLTVAVPLIPLSILVVRKRASRSSRMQWMSYSRLSAYFLDSIQGLSELKCFGAEERRAQEIKRRSWEFRDITMRGLRLNLVSVLFMDVIAYGGAALGVVLAILAHKAGRTDIFGAAFILLVSPQFFLPLRRLGALFHAGRAGVSAAGQILEILEQPSLLKGDAGPFELDGGAPSVELSHVSYVYEGSDEAALKDINLKIESGKSVAIVGPSGSGKSTLVALLSRSFDPSAGVVSLDGRDISRAAPSEIVKHLGLVNQKPWLLTGTVADNLRLAKPDATVAEIVEACRKTGTYRMIEEMPLGLDTALGEGGAKISGGQRQCVAIARAALKGAPILILDEATSNVDAIN